MKRSSDLTDEEKDSLGNELVEVLRQFVAGPFKEHDLRVVNAAIAPIAERYDIALEALRRVDDPRSVTIFHVYEVGAALASGTYRRALP